MLRKIISGGQSGSDEAGLRAAKECGLETGGWMPLGWLTETGPRPDIGELYGMIEYTSPLYPPRTIMNVAKSDGTLRLAVNFKTAGEKCTLRAIKDLKRPYLDIPMLSPCPVSQVCSWIIDNQIQTLNVAGNRESTHPGLEELVYKYLVEVFKQVISWNGETI